MYPLRTARRRRSTSPPSPRGDCARTGPRAGVECVAEQRCLCEPGAAQARIPRSATRVQRCWSQGTAAAHTPVGAAASSVADRGGVPWAVLSTSYPKSILCWRIVHGTGISALYQGAGGFPLGTSGRLQFPMRHRNRWECRAYGSQFWLRRHKRRPTARGAAAMSVGVQGNRFERCQCADVAWRIGGEPWSRL